MSYVVQAKGSGSLEATGGYDDTAKAKFAIKAWTYWETQTSAQLTKTYVCYGAHQAISSTDAWVVYTSRDC